MLVCNAGIWEGASIEEMTEDQWNRVINTNLKSAWAMTKACVPSLRKRQNASIVMVSSTSGQRGEANYSNYSASKGGQISFTKALASELGAENTSQRRRSWLDRNGDGTTCFRGHRIPPDCPKIDPIESNGCDRRCCARYLFLAFGLVPAYYRRDP
jgi:hypothetical protein